MEDEEELRGYFFITSSTAGGLLDPVKRSLRSWLAGTDEGLPAVVDEFFAMVDGPMRDWIDDLLPAERLLTRIEGDLRAYSGDGVEPAAVLALLEDRPALARGLLAHALDRAQGAGGGRADVRTRLVRFEGELASRCPAYGAPAARTS